MEGIPFWCSLATWRLIVLQFAAWPSSTAGFSSTSILGWSIVVGADPVMGTTLGLWLLPNAGKRNILYAELRSKRSIGSALDQGEGSVFS